jgi:hypothetical protein
MIMYGRFWVFTEAKVTREVGLNLDIDVRPEGLYSLEGGIQLRL